MCCLYESVRACRMSYEEEDTCVVYTSLYGRVRPVSEWKCILYGAFTHLKVKLLNPPPPPPPPAPPPPQNPLPLPNPRSLLWLTRTRAHYTPITR